MLRKSLPGANGAWSSSSSSVTRPSSTITAPPASWPPSSAPPRPLLHHTATPAHARPPNPLTSCRRATESSAKSSTSRVATSTHTSTPPSKQAPPEPSSQTNSASWKVSAQARPPSTWKLDGHPKVNAPAQRTRSRLSRASRTRLAASQSFSPSSMTCGSRLVTVDASALSVSRILSRTSNRTSPLSMERSKYGMDGRKTWRKNRPWTI